VKPADKPVQSAARGCVPPTYHLPFMCISPDSYCHTQLQHADQAWGEEESLIVRARVAEALPVHDLLTRWETLPQQARRADKRLA